MPKIPFTLLFLCLLGCSGCQSTQYLRYPDKSSEIQEELRKIDVATIYLRNGTKVVNTTIEMETPDSIIVDNGGYPRRITMGSIKKIRYTEQGDALLGAALCANPGLFVAVAGLSAFGLTLPGVAIAALGAGLLATGSLTGALFGSPIETKTLIVYEAPLPAAAVVPVKPAR